ncbi:MAG: NHLP bacteriocin export ABC transporter permease/ATPase subunit, partial [Cyanobacteria bacterium J06659_2]
DASRRLLFQVGFGLLAASLGMAMFQLGQRRLLLRAQTSTDLTTQAAIWDRLLKLKLSFFRQYSTGDLKNRIAAIGQIRALLGGTTLPTLLTSLFTLLNLLLLFFYSADLAWIAIIIAGMALLLTNTVRLMASQKFWQLQELEGTLFGTMVQMIGGISKLRVAGAEKRAFAYWAKQYQQQLTLVMDTQGLEDSLTGLNTVLPVFSSIIFFWFAVPLINPAEAGGSGLSTGAFLAFNAAFGAFIAAITDLSNTSINLLRAGIRWRRVRPILEAEPEVNESKANPGRLAGHLKLDRITFRYRPDGPLILDHVTLEAQPGEFVAIVGPSGSGKSTLIRLLLGFETPEHGTIYYDRQDLSELDLTAIRRQLGVVLQNGRITSAALFENIAAGALITLDQAWEAAALASFADDIQAMPMGMHTVISEGGSNLSGGQRQRLLIARALVLKPKILILDEATSALDNQTQADISQNLAQMQVTRVAIAHRLSTIRHADRIYVLEQGSVVQQGTFEQLVEQPGLFQRMMARQLV